MNKLCCFTTVPQRDLPQQLINLASIESSSPPPRVRCGLHEARTPNTMIETETEQDPPTCLICLRACKEANPREEQIDPDEVMHHLQLGHPQVELQQLWATTTTTQSLGE